MNVLVIGGGGREHALCWKISQSPLVERLYCVPGNAGTAMEAKVENVAIAVDDYDGLLQFARERNIELTIVGPEQPLVEGIGDRFRQQGRLILAPSAAAAQLEGSKIFAKELMNRSGVPTAEFVTFRDLASVQAHLRQASYPLVIKADGLAAGKGVAVCHEHPAAEAFVNKLIEQRLFGRSGERLLVEAMLTGREVSVIGLCCGDEFRLMLPARDHKSLREAGEGPNTGGMGAFTPVAELDSAFLDRVAQRVFYPVLHQLKAEGMPFHGVLYAGLMVQEGEPQVLEFNVRFGDPEAQPLLFHFDGDLLPHLLAVARGELSSEPFRWRSGCSLCVVLASDGYPGAYEKGLPLPQAAAESCGKDIKLFHAGTTMQGDRLVTSGGRVLGLTVHAHDIKQARDLAYKQLPALSFPGAQFRQDIGLP